jgi:hypothetical protein
VAVADATLLAAFAARLTEALDADAVTEDLARSVHSERHSRSFVSFGCYDDQN